MVDEDAIGRIVLKLLFGFMIYFAVVNLLIYKELGNPLTPRDWLINPIFNLFIQFNITAFMILIICEIVGWFLFESNQ